MKKIFNLKELAAKSKQLKNTGKKIGLITGCFDILHAGHVDLFHFAKKNVDILIVALDSDKAIKSGKGPGRPIHTQAQRAKILSELSSVDFVLPIEEDYIFTKESCEPVHDKIRDAISPDFLITAPAADLYWESKKQRAEKTGVKMLLFSQTQPTSSSKIISALELL